MNKNGSMNIADFSEKNLVTRLREKLMGLLDEVAWLESAPMGAGMEEGDFALVNHVKGERRFTLWVDCKMEPRPSLVPLYAQRREKKPSPVDAPCLFMLGAPYITPRLASVCKEAGWGWIDLAGNCRVDIPGLIHIERSGNEPVHKRPTPPVNFSSPEAARILRVLLAPQRTGMVTTQRGLRDLCQPSVSLGLVNKVVTHLKEEAYVQSSEKGHGGFRMKEPRSLLEVWREAYPYTHHQQRTLFTLLKRSALQAALNELGKKESGRIALAAFSAANLYAPSVRQPRTWLYVEEDALDAVKLNLEAKEVDSGHNLQVLIPFDAGICADSEVPGLDAGGVASPNRVSATSPVQTYVDLWHAGGRGRKAAEAILEQVLVPAWNEAEENDHGS
jgi:hypothetical protein